jgi:hypothetical protein
MPLHPFIPIKVFFFVVNFCHLETNFVGNFQNFNVNFTTFTFEVEKFAKTFKTTNLVSEKRNHDPNAINLILYTLTLEHWNTNV